MKNLFLGRSWILWCFALFLVLVLVKWFIVQDSYGPHLFFDEFVYKQIAKDILNGNLLSKGVSYEGAYPPMYPLTLIPALLSQEYFYKLILFTNVITSSLVVFPAWLIARRFLSRWGSIVAVVLVALLPFSVIYPQHILSENVVVPLYMLVFYWATVDTAFGRIKAIFFGIGSAALLLTKFFLLPLVPILVVAWFLRTRATGLKTTKKIFYFLLGALPPLIAWVTYVRLSDLAWSRAWGSRQIVAAPVQATFKSLVMFTTAYSSHAVLLYGSLFAITVCGIFLWLRYRKHEWRKDIWFVSVLALQLAGGVALATRHSWTAANNYPEPIRIIGRYIMHLTPLLIIVGLRAFNILFNEKIPQVKYKIFFVYLSSALVAVLAYLVLFRNIFWNFNPGFTTSTYNNSDVFFLQKAGLAYLALGIIVFIGILLVPFVRDRLSNRGVKTAFFSTCVLLIFFAFFVDVEAFRQTRNRYEDQFGKHAHLLASHMLKEKESEEKTLILLDSVDRYPDNQFSYGLPFWNVPPGSFVLGELNNIDEYKINDYQSVYIISRSIREDALLEEYSVTGRKFYLYRKNPK